MGYDVYCPSCEEDFDDGGDWEGQCPTCGRKWYRDETYCYETEDCMWDIYWEPFE